MPTIGYFYVYNEYVRTIGARVIIEKKYRLKSGRSRQENPYKYLNNLCTVHKYMYVNKYRNNYLRYTYTILCYNIGYRYLVTLLPVHTHNDIVYVLTEVSK